jgi:hypothetical protein
MRGSKKALPDLGDLELDLARARIPPAAAPDLRCDASLAR